MRRLALAPCVVVAFCAAVVAAALAAFPVTGEIEVGGTVAGQGERPSVAMDADGDFAVAWEGPDADLAGIFVQRFSAAGAAQGGAAPVNLTETGEQTDAGVGISADGDVAVAWQGQDTDANGVFMRRFPAGGAPRGEVKVNPADTGDQDDPAIASDSGGDMVVAWDVADGAIRARIMRQSGAPSGEISVNATVGGLHQSAVVAADTDGDFVVAWETDDAGGDTGIAARRVNAAGVPQGGDIPVNTTTIGDQERPAIAMDGAGNFAVAWESPDAAGDGDIFVRRFNAAGVPQSGEIPINVTTNGTQERPAVAMDADGDFAVAWSGQGPGEGSGVWVRDFTASGAPLAGETLANAALAGVQERQNIASDSDGDLALAWETDANDVFARRFARSPGQPGGGGGGGGGGGPGPSQTPPVLDDMGLPVLTDADVGVRANVALLRGTVLLGIPDGLATAGHRDRASQKGVDFVPLTQARQIPIGSFLDTRRGTVRLRTATGSQNATQTGDFSRGLFQVLQSSRRSARGLTELRMKGSSFRGCRAGDRRGNRAGAAQLSRRTIRRVRSNANGRFRTRGRHSAATVRGTVWETIDRCDGTLTKVTRGSVVVRDFRRRKNIVVRAGKRTKGPGGGRGSYLARAG